VLPLTNLRYCPCECYPRYGPWESFSESMLAISGLFYNVFKGFGKIGADFVRLSLAIESSGRRRPSDYLNDSLSGPTSTIKSPLRLDGKAIGLDSIKGAGRILKAAVRAPISHSGLDKRRSQCFKGVRRQSRARSAGDHWFAKHPRCGRKGTN
jgi:hypothetical protein